MMVQTVEVKDRDFVISIAKRIEPFYCTIHRAERYDIRELK